MSNTSAPTPLAGPGVDPRDTWFEDPDPTVAQEPDEPSGYVSTSELMAWLAGVTGARYDDMRDAMMKADERRELQEKLTQIKADIDASKGKTDMAVYAELSDEMKALMAEYRDTPYAEELDKILAGPAEALDQKVKDGTKVGGEHVLDSWNTKIQATIDSLAKKDQLALIGVQQLSSEISQQTQLASNLMASASHTLDNTVGNIRG